MLSQIPSITPTLHILNCSLFHLFFSHLVPVLSLSISSVVCLLHPTVDFSSTRGPPPRVPRNVRARLVHLCLNFRTTDSLYDILLLSYY
ncbi:hypothetical protein [Phaffia rhodozyma]|uniref:Uncharacterized protein n=1 Tax=Phaffia rhodozyma TaxID=264483 RepID=A0A0F7SIZ3_PHARH|nr:hypothetical protein [Phaffia rhodozyma]